MMRYFSLLLLLTFSVASVAKQLTLDRLHDDLGLAGVSPRMVTMSPDGTRVTFLRSRDNDQSRLDLWEYNLQDKVTRRLLDSMVLQPNEVLSDEEKARRERQRMVGLRGIISYSWSPDGKQLMVPIGSDIFLVDIAKPDEARRIASGNILDPQVSPMGKYVSFVRNQNLYVVDLATGKEQQLTKDGTGTIHNAEAEFVAQEEMGQRSGYWWAPDDSAIAFKKFDEAPVPIAQRFEIYADRTAVIEQRYPYAGAKNVLLSLAVVNLADGRIRPVDLGAETDIYLPRVHWSRDAKQLLFQREARSQQKLELISVDVTTLAQRVLITETSKTWINLHDDLRFQENQPTFIWASERNGYKHLYLYNRDGKLLHPISSGNWRIDNVLAVDEKAGVVYVASNRDAVIDKQVYALKLDGSNANAPKRITKANGWHEVSFAKSGGMFIDTWSEPATPPQVSVRAPDDSVLTWIERNELNDKHPYAPYRDAHQAMEFGTLTAEDGQTLHYAMIKPTGFDPKKRYPVLINVYGGPGSQMVSRRWGSLYNQYLAQQGYIIFSLDNRGSSRRERRFTDVIYGNMGKYETIDQLAGVDWLAKQSYVDAKRIGVFGWSYGGFMTLRLLAAGSDRIAAGISGAPVTDWGLYDTHYTERFMNHPKDNVAGYKDSSVFTHLAGLKSRLQLIHGMADDNVLFTNSTKLISALTAQGTLFDLMTYPGEKHGFSARTSRLHRDRAMEEFFAKTLGKGPTGQ